MIVAAARRRHGHGDRNVTIVAADAGVNAGAKK
jgi:hypothetical protein